VNDHPVRLAQLENSGAAGRLDDGLIADPRPEVPRALRPGQATIPAEADAEVGLGDPDFGQRIEPASDQWLSF